MANYRVYLLDSHGKIKVAHELACETDDEASEAAKRLLAEGPAAEVWIGSRLVGRIQGAAQKES